MRTHKQKLPCQLHLIQWLQLCILWEKTCSNETRFCYLFDDIHVSVNKLFVVKMHTSYLIQVSFQVLLSMFLLRIWYSMNSLSITVSHKRCHLQVSIIITKRTLIHCWPAFSIYAIQQQSVEDPFRSVFSGSLAWYPLEADPNWMQRL